MFGLLWVNEPPGLMPCSLGLAIHLFKEHYYALACQAWQWVRPASALNQDVCQVNVPAGDPEALSGASRGKLYSKFWHNQNFLKTLVFVSTGSMCHAEF